MIDGAGSGGRGKNVLCLVHHSASICEPLRQAMRACSSASEDFNKVFRQSALQDAVVVLLYHGNWSCAYVVNNWNIEDLPTICTCKTCGKASTRTLLLQPQSYDAAWRAVPSPVSWALRCSVHSPPRGLVSAPARWCFWGPEPPAAHPLPAPCTASLQLCLRS